ncbi:hypothetical protein L9F63_010683 [Diploptera punctata]|uniref:Ionotropic glutamate receptor C-terminal domain-containing protein n=1 Tax=Diploptera punctata TaxID=6984 RepID=A0AAD8AG92_DIPPU|nr:hypothetical protein L9F63_010683 [Diploptera punctata]
MLQTTYPLVVVIDLNYQKNIHILKKVKETQATLDHLYLPLTSHVTLVQRDNATNQFVIQDVYHVGKEQSLTVSKPNIWNKELHFPPEVKRVDYGGIEIPTVVLAQGTWEDFTDPQYRHINTDSKYHYSVMKIISEMLNFRIKVCLTNSWGYPINGSHCFTGAVGLIQCGNCEIGATGLLFKTERLDIIDYAGETIEFRGSFMFLKPSLSAVSIIYELPFSTSIWITYIVTIVILAMVLMLTRRVHHHMSKSTQRPVTWGETIVDVLAIVFQQDALHVPRNISSRILFIFVLILSLFMTTSYSAIIVSLLQTSSNAIKTLSDLMKSPLKLSMVDVFVNETTDPEVTWVFKEKLYTQPFQEAFTTEEIGVHKIRRGLFAFHGLSGSYKIISDIFEEGEKCRYQEIKMFSSLHMSLTARKDSPYTPHIKERVSLLRETGLLDREDKKWFHQKPKCETAGQNFVIVNFQDFYPALLVLAYGILGSIGILMAELLYKKKQRLCTSFTSSSTVTQKF